MNNIVRLTLLSCCLFGSQLLLAASARAENVNVYTSANFAPLMLGGGQGIYPDLVAHLNRQKIGSLTFTLRYMPRKRLQVKLEEGTLDGIVIGMMPEWLADPRQKKYLWTAPFATDRFALVSAAAAPANPDVAVSLAGKSIGTTTGYVYPGLDNWFARSGLKRAGGISDEKNIEKLLLGRVDCVLVAESMARYFIRTHGLHARLQVYPMPGPGTERRFMFQRSQAALFDQVAPVVVRLKTDPVWQRIAAGYE
jgi:polar amino acid transport system substrate-binding protein